MNKNLWTYEATDEYELDDLTDVIIKNAEKKLGFKLPDSYLDVVKDQNGGRLHLNTFTCEKVEDGFIVVEFLHGISISADEGILLTSYLVKEWDLPSNIVILYSEGHQSIFLDYRLSENTPSVSMIDTELEIDLILAEDFDAFISNLEHSFEGEKEAVLKFENEYTPNQFQAEVLKGEDAFAITDGFYYFSEVGADPNWLLHQGIILTENEDELIVQEAMGYLLRLVASSPEDKLNKELIKKLIDTLSNHREPPVKKYASKFSKFR